MAKLKPKSPQRRQAKVADQLLLPRPRKVEQSLRKVIWRRSRAMTKRRNEFSGTECMMDEEAECAGFR